MPYLRDSYFNPSDKYKTAWSLTPQGRTLSLDGFKTSSMYASLSSSIPIFYVLMFLAIAFDMYLGFSVLAKSGVNIMLIVGAILFDFFFAVLPVLLASVNIDSFKHSYVDNMIFKAELQCMTKRREDDGKSHIGSIQLELDKYKRKKMFSKIISTVLAALIFAIAGWKIFTYYSVLPPGMNIFSMVNGKIVIIFSFLCAVFHLIGSEKAIAHFMFWLYKSEYKSFLRRRQTDKPEKESMPIDYVGTYKPASFGNTAVVVKEDGSASIEYIHIIWDDEIKELILRQTDDNAKRGIAITCKETQLI